MPEMIRLRVDGKDVFAFEGSTVLAAVMAAGRTHVRRSVGGEPRGALCGMGVCHECRLVVDGMEHVKACQVTVAEGMEVLTDG
jgi:predicted molibdopterin-dependent oxidoreductase YjgC